MISNVLLSHAYLRLMEIFSCINNAPFAGITVIVVEDQMQLPPVKAESVYLEYKNAGKILCLFWNFSKLSS